jgi:hypothetical protein
MRRWLRKIRGEPGTGDGGLEEAQRAMAVARTRLEATRRREPVVSRLIDRLVELEEPNHVSERVTELLRRGYGPSVSGGQR